jgi:hypothetical protein
VAYTSVAAVGTALGQDLSGFASQRANQLLGAADRFIDGRSGRAPGGWATTAPVTGELHQLYGRGFYLRHAPVAAVTSLEVRPPLAGSSWAARAAGEYELLDAAQGQVLLAAGAAYAGWWARAAYTPGAALATADPRIVEAATQLVAHWLRPTLDGVGGDVKSYSVGQELSVTFRDPGTGTVLGVPAEIVALIDQAAGGAALLAFA